MKIALSSHLKIRLKERLIPTSYPQKILSSPDAQYQDAITGHYIATRSLKYNEKVRPMVIAYDIIGKEIQVVTIYPTTHTEIANRVKNTRWIKYEKS